MSGEDMIRPT